MPGFAFSSEQIGSSIVYIGNITNDEDEKDFSFRGYRESRRFSGKGFVKGGSPSSGNYERYGFTKGNKSSRIGCKIGLSKLHRFRRFSGNIE